MKIFKFLGDKCSKVQLLGHMIYIFLNKKKVEGKIIIWFLFKVLKPYILGAHNLFYLDFWCFALA